MSSDSESAVALYSAAGDAFAGRRPAFGLRRASLVARFARARGADERAADAAWLAGALAETGRVQVVVPAGTSERQRALALADYPLHGARIASALPGVLNGTADAIRWHREHDDGTGFPDRLRWDAIPETAVALGIAHAFLAAVEDPDEPKEPGEALFAIVAESGRRFRIETASAFRDFLAPALDAWDAPYVPELTALALDLDEAVVALAARIDARDSESAGRSVRLAARASALAAAVDADAARAARLAHLLALGRTTESVAYDDFDPLSRFGREQRLTLARRAADVVAAVPALAAEAPLLAQTARWYEDGGVDVLAAVLALCVAVDTLDPLDAPRRIAAAAGTQFDPVVARAYLAGAGAPT